MERCLLGNLLERCLLGHLLKRCLLGHLLERCLLGQNTTCEFSGCLDLVLEQKPETTMTEHNNKKKISYFTFHTVFHCF